MAEEEEPRVPFWNHVWVTPADANRLARDAMADGYCYVKINRQPGARVEGERIDPRHVRPAARKP